MRNLRLQTTAKTATLSTAAAAALFALPHPVDAAVIYSGIKDITLSVTGTHFGSNKVSALLNIVTGNVTAGAMGEIDVAVTNVGTFGLVKLVGANGVNNGILQSPGNLARKLAAGSVISAGAPSGFAPVAGGRNIKFESAGSNAGLWASNVDALAGFQFAYPMSSAIHYGWIQLHWNDNSSLGNTYPASVTIVQWGYESIVGAPISAGTPEPNSALLLLAGAGCFALNRRRAAKKTPPALDASTSAS